MTVEVEYKRYVTPKGLLTVDVEYTKIKDGS